jgi:hypothetical protein
LFGKHPNTSIIATLDEPLSFMVLEPSSFTWISPNLPVTLVSLKYLRV